MNNEQHQLCRRNLGATVLLKSSPGATYALHGAGAEFQESGRCLWDSAAARQRSEAGWQVAGEVCEDEETVERKRNQKGVIVEVVEDRRQACRC
jgi:hypothetical protein